MRYAATGNMGAANLIGEGGYGKVYRGTLGGAPGSHGERRSVAVKVLDRDSLQGVREFQREVHL